MSTTETGTSHPEKVFFPESGHTKADVVDYYRAIAETMVPHLRGRPLMMRRFPDGIGEPGWFQKEAAEHFPDWVRVQPVPRRGSDERVHHVLVDDADTLVYLADQATIEFHVWPATADDLEHPDLMVIDLDPAQGIPVARLREAARKVRDRFERLGLRAFVQATGGRGFHVVAPLEATADFDETRKLAAAIAERLACEDPEQLTTEQRKDKRGNRIFLDVNRNGYAQTFIAPYSVRARSGAPVATPLDWHELGRADPDGWDPKRIRSRLAHKPDPWRCLRAEARTPNVTARALANGEAEAPGPR